MKQLGIDILAFGAHADDVEIGMGGSLAKWAAAGKKIVICDLTEAELSSNGDVITRRKEAQAAANMLHVTERINLKLPDRGLFLTDEYIRLITTVIRKYQPKLIFAPYHEDRHPDHGNCGKLVREAYFSAGIKKYKVENDYLSYKPMNLFYYQINGHSIPDFVVDITDFMDRKIKALEAYHSQFFQGEESIQTPLTEGYIESVTARERILGKDAGTRYAEAFFATRPILINHDLFGENI